MARLLAMVAVGTTFAWLASTTAYAQGVDPQVHSADGHFISQPDDSASAAPDGQLLPAGIAITPAFGTGFASDDDLDAAVGTVTISMSTCPAQASFDDEREVAVSISKPDFETAPVINELLLKAVRYAWDTCPQSFPSYGFPGREPLHYDVAKIDIFMPDGSVGFTGSLGLNGQGDGGMIPGRIYHWTNLNNPYGRALQQAEQQNTQAQAYTAQQAATFARYQAEQKATAKGWGGFWSWVQLFLFLCFVWWLWSMREMFIGWWYALTPHPAADLVHARIHGDGDLDGALFAEIMRPVPGDRVMQRVRIEQARALAAEARTAAEWRLHELERERERAIEEAVYVQAQRDLRNAVEAHELTIARLDALKNWRKRHVEDAH